jgi:hypothetical protein
MSRPPTPLAILSTGLWLLLAPGPTAAAPPSGEYAIPLGGNQSIWIGPAAEDEFCEGFAEGFGSEADCNFSFDVDGKGKIAGSASLNFDDDDIEFHLSGPIKGKQKGDDRTGITDVSFSLNLSGTGGDGMTQLPVSGELGFEGQVNAAGVMTGMLELSLCVKGGECIEDVQPIDEDLDDGDWELLLDVTHQNGVLGGTASASFGEDTGCDYSISGKYNTKKDESSLKLTPTGGDCDGTSISMKGVHVNGPLMGDLKYKLFGSRGDATVTSD